MDRALGNRVHFMVHVTYFGFVSTLLAAFMLYVLNVGNAFLDCLCGQPHTFWLIAQSGESLYLFYSMQLPCLEPAVPFTRITWSDVGLLTTLGMLAFLAQCLLNAGLQLAHAGVNHLHSLFWKRC